MDETSFNRELNKYQLVRRPGHVGPVFRKQQPAAKAPTTTKSTAAQRTAVSKEERAPPPSTPDSGFWTLLSVYLSEKDMKPEQVEKVVTSAKRILEAGKSEE